MSDRVRRSPGLPVHERVPMSLRSRVGNRPRTRVSGYILRVVTSDPSKHIQRRLLSCLHHPKKTVARRGPPLTGARRAPPRPPGRTRNRRNRPRTWVSGYILRVVTSDPSKHIQRRLLSCLHHQKTMVSRSCSTLTGARQPPLGGAKPSKSAPHIRFGLYLPGLDIRSIETRPERSAELSRSPENGSITFRFILPVAARALCPGVRNRRNQSRTLT